VDAQQAIYNAVCSKIYNGNIGDAVQNAIRESNIGHYFMLAGQEIQSAASEMQRPSVLFRPRLFLDGNMYCALYGDDLMNGCGGFGETADKAMRDFDLNWWQQNAPMQQGA